MANPRTTARPRRERAMKAELRLSESWRQPVPQVQGRLRRKSAAEFKYNGRWNASNPQGVKTSR
jgi:hypothetical protein